MFKWQTHVLRMHSLWPVNRYPRGIWSAFCFTELYSEVMGNRVLVWVLSFPIPHFFHQLPADKQIPIPKVANSTDLIHSENQTCPQVLRIRPTSQLSLTSSEQKHSLSSPVIFIWLICLLLYVSPGKANAQHWLGQTEWRSYRADSSSMNWSSPDGRVLVMQILGSREPVKWLLLLIVSTVSLHPPQKHRRNTICLSAVWLSGTFQVSAAEQPRAVHLAQIQVASRCHPVWRSPDPRRATQLASPYFHSAWPGPSPGFKQEKLVSRLPLFLTKIAKLTLFSPHILGKEHNVLN